MSLAAPEPASERDVRVALAEGFAPNQDGGDAAVFIDVVASPVGALIVAASADAVCALEFVERARLGVQVHSLRRRFSVPVALGMNDRLTALRTQLEEYFAGVRRSFEVPLFYPGTPFQENVWSTLQEIPFGQTWSYLQLAERIGDPGATRAVGMANGANPLAILIPCHRVVNAGGALGGYGGGLWRKRALLDLEKGQLQLAL